MYIYKTCTDNAVKHRFMLCYFNIIGNIIFILILVTGFVELHNTIFILVTTAVVSYLGLV